MNGNGNGNPFVRGGTRRDAEEGNCSDCGQPLAIHDPEHRGAGGHYFCANVDCPGKSEAERMAAEIANPGDESARFFARVEPGGPQMKCAHCGDVSAQVKKAVWPPDGAAYCT